MRNFDLTFTLISFKVPVTVITGQLGSGKNDDK